MIKGILGVETVGAIWGVGGLGFWVLRFRVSHR